MGQNEEGAREHAVLTYIARTEEWSWRGLGIRDSRNYGVQRRGKLRDWRSGAPGPGTGSTRGEEGSVRRGVGHGHTRATRRVARRGKRVEAKGKKVEERKK